MLKSQMIVKIKPRYKNPGGSPVISNDIDEPEEKTPTYKMKEEIEQVTKEMEEEKSKKH